MLRTTIQTRDEKTNEELPVPADLLARVRRAADILAEVLKRVSEKFDIEARWWFEREVGQEFDALLSLSTSGRAICYSFPPDQLRDDDSIRHNLWKPIDFLIPVMSAEVDRMLERIRNDLAALATTAEA